MPYPNLLKHLFISRLNKAIKFAQNYSYILLYCNYIAIYLK